MKSIEFFIYLRCFKVHRDAAGDAVHLDICWKHDYYT